METQYKMSLDLGHNKSYIQSISSGKALPSMVEFLYICDYLNVTPKEFFDGDMKESILMHRLSELAGNLCAEDLNALIAVAERLQAK